MAPNEPKPGRCFFHTHTCLLQAFPGYTRAHELSHTCFHKPTPSSSSTSNSHTSLDPPASPLFPNPKGERTARPLTPGAETPRTSGVGAPAPRGCGVGEERKKNRGGAPPPPPGAHPLPAPLPPHCASGPEAAVVPGCPQAPSVLPPAGCPRGGRHTKPGEPAPAAPEHGEREQALADLRGCCGRAASAGDTDRWAHGGVALGRPSLVRLRWRQYLLSPPTSLPPTPPPSSPPPPPPNHRSTEGETQRLTTTWLPPPPPLPSPPAHRASARHSGRKGRGSTHRGAPPFCGFRRFSRALGAGRQELCACARSRRSRVSAVPQACTPPPSPCGLAAGAGRRGGTRRGRAPRLGRRRRGVAERCVRVCLPAGGLDFRIRLPSASSLVAHCSPPTACAGVSACGRAVLPALSFWGAATHRSRTVIQALRVHPRPLPAARRRRRRLSF